MTEMVCPFTETTLRTTIAVSPRITLATLVIVELAAVGGF